MVENYKVEKWGTVNAWAGVKWVNAAGVNALLGLKPLALRARGFKPNKTLLLVY
jgi:hypothetical protein